MKKYNLILILLCLFGNITFLLAQPKSYSTLSIPPELLKDADEVFRVDYMKINIENPKTATVQVKYVITLLNDESYASRQAVYYDKHTKINKISAKIYNATGKEVRKIKGKEFKDHSAISGSTIYSDSRYKEIELYHSSYPYTIEIEYSKTLKNIPFLPSSYMQSYGTSIEHFEYIVEVASGYDINYKVINTELEPKIKQNDKAKIYTWRANNLPALKREPYAPYYQKIRPGIMIAPEQFQFDNYEGDMTSWANLGKFIYDLNKGRDEISPELSATIKELTANASTDKEKIDILYKYLQDNTRYVSVQLGIGGWQTFDAEYVEKNKYGDCKALSNFMKTMLKEVGVEAYQILIYSDRDDKVELFDDFAYPAFANHVILNVPSENIWLECTSSDFPPNYIGYGNHDREVLMLSEEGGKVLKTPGFSLDQNCQANKASIVIDENGGAIIQQDMHFAGPRHDYYRYLSKNLSSEDMEKRFIENSDLPAFTVDKLKVKNSNHQPECTVEFDISIPRYASKAGKRIFIPLNKLNPYNKVPRKIEKRIHPVHVKNQSREKDVYHFTIPEGYELESLPKEAIKLESEFGKYHVSFSVNGNQVIYKRLFEIYSVELPAEKYDALRNFYKEVAKSDGVKMVLVKKRT